MLKPHSFFHGHKAPLSHSSGIFFMPCLASFLSPGSCKPFTKQKTCRGHVHFSRHGAWLLGKSNKPLKHIPWRIHGAGRNMLTKMGYIDEIHVSIYTSTMDPIITAITRWHFGAGSTGFPSFGNSWHHCGPAEVHVFPSWFFLFYLLWSYPSRMVFMENPSISWMMNIWVWINTY